jgi:hypothetical protein
MFTNWPEDWHFWRSARSEAGEPCGMTQVRPVGT